MTININMGCIETINPEITPDVLKININMGCIETVWTAEEPQFDL